jgi:hypothetical protein
MSNRRRLKANRGRAVVVPGVTLSLGLGLGVLQCAPTTADTTAVDLLTAASIRIDGAVAGDDSGSSVAGAGDVNGDGRPDVIIGAPEGDNAGRTDSGSSYVVFGQASPTTVDLANLGSAGFRIDGAAPADFSGQSVAGAGDVNGDGLADVVIGAPGSLSNQASPGSSYVVFGKAGTTPVDLASLGSGGFRIDGATYYHSGISVAGAGDVNGDGLADVIVGAPGSSNNGRTASGSGYVVFGKTGTATVDLAGLGSDGFRIDGATAWDYSGSTVTGAGDVNGDGRADVIVAAPRADNNGRDGSGSTHVVFGRSGTASVDLAALGAGGFRIDGATELDGSGRSVAGAGDVNGDGLADVIIGAPFADNTGGSGWGRSYVVFGKAGNTTVDLAALGAGGFRINDDDPYSGQSVAGAGDVNGDGLADVIVGAPGSSNNGRDYAGSSYVVFGKAGPAAVDLANLGAAGLQIDGAAALDVSGRSVAGAGDVNGDGLADVIIGAPFADNNSRNSSGSSFVVFGKANPTPPLTPPPPPATAPKAQTAKVKVPKKITAKGTTVLLKKAVVTNAGQKAASKVTWSTKKSAKGAKKLYAKVTTTRSGKLAITTTGKAKKLYVKLRLAAPATVDYAPYRFTTKWTVKK